MRDTSVKASPLARLGKIALRTLTFFLVAFTVGWMLNHVAASMEQCGRPAGFKRGVVQGALMPMALPSLLFGRDVMIYSPVNTGVNYKLGYTTGVNSCGALFFGFFFWRVSRWRKKQ
jgi:hypothetical protein